MNDILSNCNFSDIINKCKLGDLDVNKLLVILLLLTNKLNIEAIHVYRNNFIIWL